MSSSHSKRAPPDSHQKPYTRLWGRNWVFLPDSSEELSPSAINKKHIIGKRLRSSGSPEQTPSELKKRTADQINNKGKQSLGSGLDQQNQSVSLSTKIESCDTIDTIAEYEKAVQTRESTSAFISVDDGVSSISSLTELDDMSEASQREVIMLDTQCPNDEEAGGGMASSSDSSNDNSNATPPVILDHESHSSTEINLRRRVQLLEQQVNRLMLRKAEGESQTKNTIERLEKHVRKLNSRLGIFTEREGTKPKSTADEDLIDRLIAQLQSRDREIRSLKSSLNEALGLNELLSSKSNNIYAVDLTKTTGHLMYQIESSTIFAADLLCQARLSQRLQHSRQEESEALILDSIGTMNLFQSHSSAAFRAMIFKFVRDRVFYSPDMWSTLHFESLMLRAYQNTLQQGVTPGFLERFHRAALHLMLQDSNDFRDLFVIPQAEVLITDIMDLLMPFLDNILLQTSQRDERLKKCLMDLFCNAISLRASYFPPPGTRYELVQYKPGTIYDSRLMQVHPIPIEDMDTPPGDSQLLRIKVCVHGSIIAHKVDETSSLGLERLSNWSQPFIEVAENKDSDGIPSKGKLVSQRASVILE